MISSLRMSDLCGVCMRLDAAGLHSDGTAETVISTLASCRLVSLANRDGARCRGVDRQTPNVVHPVQQVDGDRQHKNPPQQPATAGRRSWNPQEDGADD